MAAALALALALTGCNTLYDTEGVVLDDTDASEDTALDTEPPGDLGDTVLPPEDTDDTDHGDTTQPGDTDATDTTGLDIPPDDTAPDAADLDLVDQDDPDDGTDLSDIDAADTLADTADTEDAQDTDDTDDTTDVPLDCTGQCGAGANCQPCGDTCVDILTSPTHCGGCNADCTSLANVASVGCFEGACRIPEVGGCDPGWGNCDDMVPTGCEHDTTADRNNCGTCGNACELLALPPEQCVAGTCE